MTYRDAIIDDLPLIVEIYNSTIASRRVTADTTPVSVESKKAWFFQHDPSTRPVWMALNDEQQIIGWISFQDFYGRPAYKGTAEISIYIDEKFRNSGYGKQMLEYSISKCSTLGISNLLCFIFEQNTESLKLTKKLGFEEWGNLKDIALLDDKTCSLIIMGKKIKPTSTD